MENRVILSLYLISSLYFLSGCHSSRNNIRSDYNESNEENLTLKGEATLNIDENTNQSIGTNEELNGNFKFTRIDFENGTTFFDMSPYGETMLNLWKYTYPNEKTEPPDTTRKVTGIKSITTGELDFNKNNQSKTETQTHANTKQTNSLNMELNTTSEILQKEDLIQKEKHGFFYWLGVIATFIIGLIVLFGMYKVFSKLDSLKRS